MSKDWQVTATMYEQNGELKLGLVAERFEDGKPMHTADQVLVANIHDAHHEARQFCRTLGVPETYKFEDNTKKMAS